MASEYFNDPYLADQRQDDEAAGDSELRPIQRVFAEFLRKVYPEQPAPGSDQYQQLRDAFFGGALIAYTTTAALAMALELKRYGAAAMRRPEEAKR